MMQSEPMFQPSWPVHSYFDSTLGQDGQNIDFSTCEADHEFYSPITMNVFDDVCKWLCDDVQEMEEIPTDSYEMSPSMSMNSSDVCASSMVNDVMETDSQMEIENLLMAHAEAMSLDQKELARVIQRCVCQKASPVGPVLERLALDLFRYDENQEKDYIFQESLRSFKTAFRAFYEIFPYGRFAHFTANSAILESIPANADSVHIVDFDLCEGSQWPPVIEAIARSKKTLIITSIKLDEDQDSQFDQKRWELCNYARSFDLNLKVQEMGMSQLVKKMDGRKLGTKEFLVFNCMVGLPHMGKTRTTNQVLDFLKSAKFILAENKGIITFGDGEQGERTGNHSDFPSFFHKNLAHYKAFYDSMERGFPSYLNEARLLTETLFLAPFVSSKSWFEKWEEQRTNNGFREVSGLLKGVKMSRESLNEARELVKEGESPYGIRTEGENGNEMVLEWSGIPLVKVSAWV
ncbi:hypothetical protein SSX86_007366 [Deinandra increscens subsp. villosa]|uniref:Nodulation signaling pathway 2-like protein n=1 Tax=Deinandra increscens subsp. villosa TaxID=3103831 RepID=A0AAP0DL18_9ASTR